ncbi:unnamed protein product, partial [marine sediment metagenome]
FFIICFIYCPLSNAKDKTYQYLQDESFTPSSIDYSALERLNYKKLTDHSRRSQSSPLYVTGFDEQIDEDTYILGTGDGLTIYIWGSINDEIISIIDHEGNFIIPSIGTVNVRNLTLREGKERIKERILTSYKKIKLSITLSIIRRFKVYVLGEVVNPGPYIVTGAARVSDLINLTGGLKTSTLKISASKDNTSKNNTSKNGALKDDALKADSTLQLRAIEIENE